MDRRRHPHPPFEVDETDPRAAGAVLGVLALLVLVVLLATPPGLLMPGWAPGLLVLVTLVAAVWWWLRRPWVVVAVELERDGDLERGDLERGDLERGDPAPWARSVPGAFSAWRYHSAVARTLGSSGQPDPDAVRTRRH